MENGLPFKIKGCQQKKQLADLTYFLPLWAYLLLSGIKSICSQSQSMGAGSQQDMGLEMTYAITTRTEAMTIGM
jgi:hypothetical protein